MKVVELHKQPPFTNIPGRLRYLADRIEQEGDDGPRTVIVVSYERNGTVRTFGYGDNPPRCELLGLLQMASANILEDMELP